jgi:hypothetical protein
VDARFQPTPMQLRLQPDSSRFLHRLLVPSQLRCPISLLYFPLISRPPRPPNVHFRDAVPTQFAIYFLHFSLFILNSRPVANFLRLFGRGSPFQTTKRRGMGIGLYQSKMIVEAHQGIARKSATEGTARHSRNQRKNFYWTQINADKHR